jgi:PAS domain-containing protein
VYTYERNGEAVEYINVERSDIAVANRLAGEILGRSLDELAPQTRTLLGLLHEFVMRQAKADGVSHLAFRFTRRDLRQAIHWSDSQVRKHLARLVDLEVVLVHRGRGGQRYVYELLYCGEGTSGQPFLVGLADAAKLQEPPSTT